MASFPPSTDPTTHLLAGRLKFPRFAEPIATFHRGLHDRGGQRMVPRRGRLPFDTHREGQMIGMLVHDTLLVHAS